MGYWVIGLLGYWVIGLLGYWVIGLLGYWVIGLLGYWVIGLLGWIYLIKIITGNLYIYGNNYEINFVKLTASWRIGSSLHFVTLRMTAFYNHK